LPQAVALIALLLGAATAADDPVAVPGFGEHNVHRFDASPVTTTAQPYCNPERLTERVQILRDRKSALTEQILGEETVILGREMLDAERARRRADLQRFIDGLVDTLGVASAQRPNDAQDAKFLALVRELAKVEKQITATIQHIERCRNVAAGGGRHVQTMQPF
jgi:hypothetical protein